MVKQLAAANPIRRLGLTHVWALGNETAGIGPRLRKCGIRAREL
jgi:hypothetical protein